MADTRVTFRVPGEFLERLDAEAAERRVTRTTILWERLGIFDLRSIMKASEPLAELRDMVDETERVELPSMTVSGPITLSPGARVSEHVHKFVRSGVTGLKKCSCGKVER